MRTSRSFISGGALALLLLGGGAAGARPAPTPEAQEAAFQEHYQRALARYSEERYEAAIEEFQAAYELRQLPRLIFNLAQAHRHLGHAQEALRYYELYQVKEPNPKPGLRAELELYITQMRTVVQQAERARRAQEQEEQLAAPTQGAPEPAHPAAAPAPQAPAPAARPGQPSLQLTASPGATPPALATAAPRQGGEATPLYRRWWLWTLVSGVVAAGAVTGIVLGVTRPAPGADPPGLDIRTITF